ncbi:tRNA preQ1(34) S-adenosylmethionine ribosyltransferase-isomerase QueA [Christensenellaceae bacterium NSJ-44]|uniref:S-adenosylmethionine:tRNA ribosyltransferase-isomerase n=1 Tax=Luoshenia tenuis TaxID=2763654 RepID=A0A926HN10_9FIRM|nr:tRNA preQ1(34) S-adenosylmethionine ribosyltransferase-isomerase QueA [Luoshenia tenuis]MBC8530104.1 tRNA preQ1(34) S-adenosylmethionine ribosyltransferase-isomerase QueA [Luoshenia tenuis]
MNKSDFYYDLPQELIAQKPMEPRDASRLMVVHRAQDRIEHRHFYDILEYLSPGDVLVVNHTRVIPARLYGRKVGTGGKIEFLLLKRLSRDEWEVILKPGKKAPVGARFEFGNGELVAEIIGHADEGGRIVRFSYEGVFEQVLERLGQMPLPPYIHERLEDRDRYQTVYAKYDGSAAAPTAGLHFTPELLDKVKQKGVEIVPILLHVGLGTFRPVKEEHVEDHHMHSEYYEVSPEAADQINAAHARGNKIFAVGTTSVRTLESVADEAGVVHAGSGWTEIFIMPGYKFKVVDALITNFHLPESTLLMLVSAFASREQILNAYKIAVQEGYQFFSFGSAQLLL